MDLANFFSRSLLLVPCCALILSGCGGSGGGGGGGSSNPAPTVNITRDNAGEVAEAAYEGNNGMGNVSELPGTVLGAGATDSQAESGLAGLALYALRHSVLAGERTIAPAGLEDDGECDFSGEAVVTLNDSNGNSVLDEGESGSVTFTECVGVNGDPTINGTMTFTLDTASETGFAFTLEFVSLTIVGGDNDEDLSASGSLSFGLESTDNPPTLTMTLSGRNLLFTEHGEALDLAGDFDFTVTTVSGNTTVDFSMTLDIDGLGVVNLSTPTPLVGNPPTSGVILVEGAGSAMTLTMAPGGIVTVAIDEGDDGSIDCSQELTQDTLDLFDPLLACP